MNRNSKLSMFLVAVTSVMLTACGNQETSAMSESETTATETAATQTETATAESETTKALSESVSTASESTSSIQRKYIDGLPVYDAWEKDLSELYELKENTPDLTFDAFGFLGYKLDPHKAVEQNVAELALGLRNNIEGMKITYIGKEDEHFLWGSDEILDTNVEDSELNTVEDVQAAMLSMVDREEQKEDYTDYFQGLIYLMDADAPEDANGCIEIHLQIHDGIIEKKSMEFTGTMRNPVSYYFSAFIMNETEATIFDVNCDENPEVIKNHTNDNLYPLNYDIEVLKQYGVEATIDEIQWEGEVGNSNLRMRLTFTNHTKEELMAQTRDKQVLNDKGEEINTFLVWSEKIPAGESKTIDVGIRNLNEIISSIEMRFHFGAGIDIIETTALKISDFTNESPTITFDNEMEIVDDEYLEMLAE